MLMKSLLLGFLSVLVLSTGDKEKLREALGDHALVGPWIYDDLEAGIAEAGRTGKPSLIVFRCVPCTSCRTIDRQVAGRQDAELAKVMERFVCVRIVQGWGLDLSLFQFDWRQTWMVFLMNSDRALYGRYDARQADDLI